MKFLFTFLFLVGSLNVFSQCPTSGVIIDDCAIDGNLNINGETLTVNSGVTVTINGGDLQLRAGSTLNATGAMFVIDGGIQDFFGDLNTINGGTYEITEDFSSGGGGDFTINGANITTTGGNVDLAGNNTSIDSLTITLSEGTVSFAGSTTVNNTTISGASSLTMNVPSFEANNTNITTSGDFLFQNATITNSNFNAGGEVRVNSGASSIDNSTINAGTSNTAPAFGIMAFDFNGGGSLTATNGSQINVIGDWRNNEINIDASNVSISGNFDNAGAEIVEVLNGGTLSIGGDFDNSDGGNVDSSSGGVITVSGNFNNTGGGNLNTNGGVVVVGGGFTGADPTGDGADCDSAMGGCCGDAVLCGTLPVSLLSFDAKYINENAVLTWQTLSEEDNDFFTVLKSLDGINFFEIGTLKGKGTTSEISDYQFVDTDLVGGGVFYRLEQTDFDGSTDVLDAVFLELHNQNENITIYPSSIGANQDLKIGNISEGLNISSVEMISASGQRIEGISVQEGTGGLLIKLPNQDVSSGIYVLKGHVNWKRFTARILVK